MAVVLSCLTSVPGIKSKVYLNWYMKMGTFFAKMLIAGKNREPDCFYIPPFFV